MNSGSPRPAAAVADPMPPAVLALSRARADSRRQPIAAGSLVAPAGSHGVPSETLTGRLRLRRLRLPVLAASIPVRNAARSAAPRPAWTVLKHPDFRWYFVGSVTSNFGTWIQTTAQVLLAFKLTHSVFAVGAVTAAQFSSSLALGPLAATVASRVGGRRLLIATQVFSAAAATWMAVMEATGRLTEGPLVIGALLLGLAFTFALPVQTALVPRLVAEPDTESAMAMNSVSYNTGRALAPAVSVLVIFTIGFGWTFAINAVSFVIYAIMLAATRPRGPARPPRPARLRDGLSVALLQPRIALLLTMVAAVTLADDPVQTVSPALVHRMGVSGDWAGFFLSALGFGTILGAFRPAPSWILQKRNHPVAPSRRTSKRAGLSLVMLSVTMIVFALGINAWVSFGAALAAGVAALWTGAVTQTQLVRHKPEFTASVVALWAIAWAGTKPLASLTDGWLASHLGVLTAAALLASPALVLGAAEILIAGDSKLKVRARQWGGNAHNWLHLPPLKSEIRPAGG